MEEELARCGRHEIGGDRYHAGLGNGPCDGVKPSMIQEHIREIRAAFELAAYPR
jgi:hypothetical protein